MMDEVVILIAEDDPGHARLIEKNLARAGLRNSVKLFENGQEVLDFLFRRGAGPHRQSGTPYLLLLDIRMPKVDGVEVLRQLKEDTALRRLPVVMLTTTDDLREIERCYELGCNIYIVKPVDYDRFAGSIKQLCHFMSLMQIPWINDIKP